MLFIALKNLFQEKTRFIISVGGVSFSVLLIIILQGLYQGWNYKMGEYIRTLPVDLWVSQKGSTDMFHSISILALSGKETIEQIAGVEKASAFNGRRFEIKVNEKEAMTYLVGYDPDSGIGGPARIIEGKPKPDNGEIIVDRVFADNNKAKIRDTIPISGENFKIVGLSDGGNLITFSYSFITKEDADRIFKLGEVANYFMVKLSDNNDQDSVARQIESSVDDSIVFTRAQFVESNTVLIRETFLPIILVLLLIGIAVGIAVIGLTIFTSTIEKSREYGVLKAIGVTNSQLYVIVIEQALAAGVVGYFIGLVLALGLNLFVGRFVPEFITLFRVIDMVWIFGVTLLMAILAAFIPSRRIAHINPAEVFKS